MPDPQVTPPVSGEPAAPTTQPEGGTPPAAPAPSTSPLDIALDGEGIPQEFKGKTVKDILASVSDLMGAKTRAEQEAAQWRTYVATQQAAPAAPAGPAPEDPLADIDPKVLQGLQVLFQNQFNMQMAPMHAALGNVMKNYVAAMAEDFPQYEERATQIFNQLPPQFRYSDQYGWKFAYNMAKAEKAGLPRPAVTHPGVAPTAFPTPPSKPTLTDDQKKIAKNLGLSEDDYIKYQTEQDIV